MNILSMKPFPLPLNWKQVFHVCPTGIILSILSCDASPPILCRDGTFPNFSSPACVEQMVSTSSHVLSVIGAHQCVAMVHSVSPPTPLSWYGLSVDEAARAASAAQLG